MVSIHAPTRGATSADMLSQLGTLVSIHAPTRGATDLMVKQGKLTEVSIHAPTRGATYTTNVLFDRVMFQSTHPHGVRPILPTFKRIFVQFQSTHPHGVRQG